MLKMRPRRRLLYKNVSPEASGKLKTLLLSLDSESFLVVRLSEEHVLVPRKALEELLRKVEQIEATVEKLIAERKAGRQQKP
jgi:hypothetical protein